MIYREMPADWDPDFRPRFYTRWGRENAVISAHSEHAEYAEFQQLLSIKAAFGGAESYIVDGVRISVDDDTFLILNSGRRYGSRIHSDRAVHSFSVFFEPALADQILRSMQQSTEALLEYPVADRVPAAAFAERLHHHDHSVSPVLRHILRAVDEGMTDDVWVTEQLYFLLSRMLKLHYKICESTALVNSIKPSTRHELLRRVGLGVNFIHTNFRKDIDLDAMATASQMSRYHFLRTFSAVVRVTPWVYLNRKRVSVALRLLRDQELPVASIAEQVGFGSRATLFRQIRAITGFSPTKIRGLEKDRANG